MKAVFLIVCLIGSSYQAEWAYDMEYRWPGVCSSGTQQSPIDINTRQAVLDRHHAHIRGPLVFRGYGHVTVTAENNGHTLRWSKVLGVQAPTLSGGPLRGNYSFLQFHLHWLSEHAIDGYKYPLEIHMVHVKTGLTLNEALARPDGLAVVGVMATLKSGPEAEHALEQLMPALPELMHRDDNHTQPEVIDLTRLLSPEPQSFYTYHGSLTTPECQEVVTWIVMDKPIAISDNQYKYFSKIDIGNAVYNYRSLHPTNRIVYRSMASCASIASPTFLGFLVILIGCATSTLASSIGDGLCMVLDMKRKIFGESVKACSKLLN
ncbi:putative carbonic anhydrase 5 [Choristoneura fumiferana]|uniref:putative carbonic anhydrase 5 n=1 Tax=Choristoneura fumiferana TaxID=7141 RepID=UPI003D15EFD4